MKKIFRHAVASFAIAAVFCVTLALPREVIAQESLVLSVTPPFSQLVVQPGDVMRSYVKVINANSFDLTVYADPVNFETADESGHPKFIPLIGDAIDKTTFAGWIDVTREAIVIPPESSKEIPYTIVVPDNAPPGGHFAAILIGTRPPEGDPRSGQLKTSQVVSSLFLARVAGEVLEGGQIRELSVANSYSGTPKAEFILRFENTGNVYIQPQGDITIFNMWGKERGFIPVNQKTNFGNVLPKSIRKFSFVWEGTPSLTDIGRYKAVATLSYGVDAKKSVDRTIYFWVIPLKATLITLGFIIAFIAFIVFSIRLYIRRVFEMAGIERLPEKSKAEKFATRTARPHAVTRKEIVAPLRAGVLDLRQSVQSRRRVDKNIESGGIFGFARMYRTFLSSSVIGLIGVALIVWYVIDARGTARPYEVVVRQEGGDVTVHSKDMEANREVEADDTVSTTIDTSDESALRQRVSIVNASGEAGASAPFVARLEKESFSIGDISTDTDTRTTSVIVYNKNMVEEAKRVSEYFGGIPLSVRSDGEETEPEILLIIGADRTE